MVEIKRPFTTVSSKSEQNNTVKKTSGPKKTKIAANPKPQKDTGTKKIAGKFPVKSSAKATEGNVQVTIAKNKKGKQAERTQASASSKPGCSTTHDRTFFHRDGNFQLTEIFTDVKKLHWSRLRLGLCFLIFFVFCLQILCTSTHHWLQLHDVHYQGIWRVCTQTKYGIRCFRYDYQPQYFKPIRAMLLVSITLQICSFVYMIYILNEKKAPAFVLTIMLAFAAVFAIGGLAWFTDENLRTVTLSSMKFGWSYYVGWIGVLFNLVSAFVSLQEDRKRVNTKQPN